MESYAPMCCDAVMSVKCVMESHALMWRRSVEREVCSSELCTGVLDAWRRSDECEVCDGESRTVVAAQWRV